MDPEVVAAVRELTARVPGLGVNAMVKHIRAERPELADRVNAKAVRAAKTALATEAEGGEHYGPAQLGGLRGHPGRCRVAAAANDPAQRQRLWQVSDDLIKATLG